MPKMLMKGFVLAVAVAGLFASGCATNEEVEKAQATADAAMAGAHQAQQTGLQAGQTAASAQQTGATAQQTADQNKSDINAMKPHLETLVALHKGPRG
jgi:hypothetical protein